MLTYLKPGVFYEDNDIIEYDGRVYVVFTGAFGIDAHRGGKCAFADRPVTDFCRVNFKPRRWTPDAPTPSTDTELTRQERSLSRFVRHVPMHNRQFVKPENYGP